MPAIDALFAGHQEHLAGRLPDRQRRQLVLVQGLPARRVCFEKLFDQATLDGAMLTRALALAGKTIASDYELSRLLVEVAETQTLEGRTRDAYLDAADQIGSSHESGQVMTALVKGERRR